MNSIDNEKCSSTNTSLNSKSSTSSNRSGSKIIKTNRATKQRKLSPVKNDLHQTIIDDYPSAICYNNDDHYYSPQNSQGNYSNFALYAAAAANYPNTSCFSTFNNSDESMYYDHQQQQTTINID